MRFNRIITGILLTTILFAQTGKEKEQFRPIPKKFDEGFVLESAESQYPHKPDEIIEIPSYIQQNYNSESNNRGTCDTMAYRPPGGFDGRNDLFPDEAMFTAFQMPADGTLKGVNIPVYEWGAGQQKLTVSLHKISYPYNADGTMYPLSAVDSTGWIGGYDMDATSGNMFIEGSTYTLGGTPGVCDTSDVVVPGALDPLGLEVATSGPPGTPLMGLLWPYSLTPAIMEPSTHPDFINGGNDANWFNLIDYGSEIDLLQGDWIGVLVASTAEGDGGPDEPTGLFSAAGAEVVDPWVSGKFYGGCTGASGNGGWHISSTIFDFELAVYLYVGPRCPRIYNVSRVRSTLSTEDKLVTAHIIGCGRWSCEGGGDIESVTITYQLDSLTAVNNIVPMSLDSGTVEDGYWSGEIPGQNPGTYVYWYLTATDESGASDISYPGGYTIFEPTPGNDLVYNNQDPLYGTILYSSYLYFYWGSESFDIWDASYDSLSAELIGHYSTIVELGSDYNNDAEIAAWWDGGKTYIVSSDEWLGVRSGWEDGPTEDGSVAKSILGIAYEYNDINYTESGDQSGISRIMVNPDGAASALAGFLSDSLYLNYDPDYETGRDNWLDGIEAIDGYTVDMTGYSFVLDSANQVDPSIGSDEYNVMIHGQAGNGGKSAFLAFDAMALNTIPAYHWVGASWYMHNIDRSPDIAMPEHASPLIAVYELLDGVVGIEEEIEQPTAFSLKGNYPNPFNPITNIHYELHKNTYVEITIYDVLGREVKKLVSGELVSGYHKVI
ncbi:MAG: hypothetical protein ACE5D0_01530, partial [Fidelibacterota bacterium]